jgi:hypothetical protein
LIDHRLHDARAPAPAAIGSISISAIVLSCSAGVSRMSLHRLRVKTRLPAPIKVMFGMIGLSQLQFMSYLSFAVVCVHLALRVRPSRKRPEIGAL